MTGIISGGRVRRRLRGGRHFQIAALGLALLTASGCAITPEPVTPEERSALIAADRQALFRNQEPVTGPISLEEAMARAIKYNLDYRLTAMDQALQNRQLDLTRYDMLPRLVAAAGGTARSNENLSVSENTRTGVKSTDPSLSQDQERFTTDLTLSWNVLDFGVSYYQARQQADRALIADERRRRVVHSVIQQVRAAYWQAVSAERIEAAIGPILAETRQALSDARSVEEQRLRPPVEVLRYQKALIEVMRQLETVEQDLAIAKAQLRASLLMSLESTGSRCEQLARQLQVHGRIIPVEETKAKIAAVTVEQVQAAAARAFRGTPTLAALGPMGKVPSLATIAEKLAA